MIRRFGGPERFATIWAEEIRQAGVAGKLLPLRSCNAIVTLMAAVEQRKPVVDLNDEELQPQLAAALVEFFPTRIRYTALSLPYHIGNGWFGGFLPPTSFAMVAATGDIYYGLWYPVVVALATFVIGLFFVPETYKRDIFKG